MTKFIKIYKLGHDEAFSDYPGLIAREEHYALDPALRKFFEERWHEFMDVNTLLTAPAVSKAIENIRAEDSRTILQLQGEKQELECKLSSYQLIVDHLNDLCEGFEKAPVWRRLWIALFPSRLCA